MTTYSSGNDNINGSKGDDVIRGGAGADRIQGGAGNDTYVFVAGDLVGSLGQNNGQSGSVDTIIDFQGAGSNTGSGYQDQLAFYGYGAGTKLVFDHYAADRVQQADGTYKLVENQKLQYYKVVDASDHSRDGYILVQMQDGTSQLTASDYTFKADAVSGTSTGDVTEAGGLNNSIPGQPTFSGKLAATTFDQATSFQALDPSALAGKYGSFAFASDGTWSYTLDNTKAATEALKAGETQNETLVVQTLDGTMKTLVVHVHGADDIVPNTPATIGGTDTGSVKEDGTLSAMGHLTISDPDAGQSAFVPHTGNDALAGTYGSLTIDAAGAWTYNLDNAKAQPLKDGQAVHDVITVASVDGTTHNIDVTVNGTNDAPTGMATAVLPPGAEDTNYVVSKAALLAGFTDIDGDTLNVTKLQAGHDRVFNVVSDNGDGTYTIEPDPDYNGPVTLNYTVSDVHGGAVAGHQSFTLAPVNDAPVANPDNVTIRENDAQYRGNVLNNDFDVDGDSLTASLTPGGTHHGSMVFNSDGSYVYTLNISDPAVNGLSDGQRLTDTYTYTASDGHGGMAQSTLYIDIRGMPHASPNDYSFV